MPSSDKSKYDRFKYEKMMLFQLLSNIGNFVNILRICTDSEQYFENLMKRKKSIQKKERKNYRRYLKITCGRWRRPLRF